MFLTCPNKYSTCYVYKLIYSFIPVFRLPSSTSAESFLRHQRRGLLIPSRVTLQRESKSIDPRNPSKQQHSFRVSQEISAPYLSLQTRHSTCAIQITWADGSLIYLKWNTLWRLESAAAKTDENKFSFGTVLVKFYSLVAAGMRGFTHNAHTHSS